MVEATTGAMGEKKVRVQEHLMAQDAATVDPTKLTALTPEVVSFPRRTTLTRPGGLDGARRVVAHTRMSKASGGRRLNWCDVVGEMLVSGGETLKNIECERERVASLPS